MVEREKRHLSSLDFERATADLTIKPAMRLAVFRYMVEKRTFEEVAQQSGLNDRSIQRKVRQIWELYQDLPALPDGWVTETVSLPESEMRKVQQRSRSLLKKLTPEKDA